MERNEDYQNGGADRSCKRGVSMNDVNQIMGRHEG